VKRWRVSLHAQPAHFFVRRAGEGHLAVIIGSDSPDLPPEYLSDAFARLEAGADVALGPADDGGYYLIGLRAPQPRLLREVPMSTPSVLADTLALFRELAARGRVGSLATCYSFMGHIEPPYVETLLQVTAPQVASKLKQERVDAVLLTPA